MGRRRDTRVVLVALGTLGLLTSAKSHAQFERPTDPVTAEPRKPKVTPPRLKHFESATYPPDALRLGLTANVVLRLTLDEHGAVLQANVEEPAGNGFDEAAQGAAMRFTFEPALRDGIPVKVTLLYRYSFTLEPAINDGPSPTVPETVPEASRQSGRLSGVLFIAGTDAPLVGVEVLAKSAHGTVMRQSTNVQGRFSFDALPPGNYHVQIEAAGFNRQEAEEAVRIGEATEVTYRIAAKAEAGAVEVQVSGVRKTREVTRRTIERREIERIPGTSGDALRSIESLPGVARPPAMAGVLIVRGSYPEDTRVYVDGSSIPLVYHFGGLRSVIPTEFIERIDFYPGNFGARFGRGMGGIVDVALKSPETRCRDALGRFTSKLGCISGLAQLDFIDGRLLLQGPLPVKGWSFAVGARRSWMDVWVGPVFRRYEATVSSLPVYDDYQLVVERQISESSRLSLRFFGANDSFAAVVDPLAQEPAFGGSLQLGTSFFQSQLLYQQQLSAKVSLSTLLTQGLTQVDFSVGSIKLHMKSRPFHWREDLGISIVKGVTVHTGLDVQVFPYEIEARAFSLPRPGEPASGPFSTRSLIESSDSVVGLYQGFYADTELLPVENLALVPAIRFDYQRDNGRVDTSPRLNVRYDVVRGGLGDNGRMSPRTTLKGGVGYYYQPPQPRELNTVFGTPGLMSNRALHYTLGVEQEFLPHLDASVEAFYKDYDQLVAPGRLPELRRLTNDGRGKAYGLETLIRYRPGSRFFGWIAYTLSRSVRQDFKTDEPYLIPYDQTHNLTVLGSYRLGRGWEFGARFRVISGSRVTPVRDSTGPSAILAADAGAYVPFQGAPFSERLPLFHQLDLRLDKRWQAMHYRVSTYLDVYNVYNHPAAESIAYDYNFAHRTFLTGIPFLPSVGVRGEF